MVDYELIKETRNTVFECENMTEETQALLLKTSKGNIYKAFVQSCFDTAKYTEMFDKMVSENDTEVREAVCMFAPGALDLPSLDVRRKILSLNSSNENMEIYVLGRAEITTVKLSDTF